MVNKHVDEGLEKEQEKANKKNKKKKQDKEKQDKQKRDKTPPADKKNSPKKTSTKESTPKKDAGTTIFKFSTNDTKPEKSEKSKKDNLPKRIFHKWFKIDPTLGVGYRGWYPQQYPTVKSKVTSYFTWSTELKGRFFNLISLKRGYYESNSISSPRHPKKENAAKYGNYATKSAWFLAELGIPIMDAWEPTIRYETRAFTTTATTKGNTEVCIVDYNGDPDAPMGDCTNATNKLTVTSAYETAVIGITYYPSKNPSPVTESKVGKAPPFFFGLGYLSYTKPYQVTIGGNVLDELLFTGKFYGGGLAFGTKLGGGVNKPYLGIWTQFGLGAAKIMEDLTLNELTPSDWLIGYIQGNLTASFKWAPFKFKPTILFVPSINVSGSTFFFMETDREAGDEFIMPNVNWDIIYSGFLSVIVTL